MCIAKFILGIQTPNASKIFKPSGIILSGGPSTVNASAPPVAPDIIFDLACPILGICYGMQTLVAQLGGQIEGAPDREFGHATLRLCGHSSLFSVIEKHNPSKEVKLDVWMSHGDRVQRLPEGFVCIAQTNNTPIAAIADEKRHLYGVQFHPEVTHTPRRTKTFKSLHSHYLPLLILLDN